MQFWRPGDEYRHANEGALSSGAAKYSVSEEQRLQFLYALERGKNVVIHEDPGNQTGKLIARELLSAGWAFEGQCIAVALPRQVSVISSAVQVAQENGLDESNLGGDCVGFVLQSNAKRSSNTSLVYFTNRSLLQALLDEPLLGSVSVVIVDAFHERSVAADLLLACLKKIQIVRDNLRVVIITEDSPHQISSYLGNTRSMQMFTPRRGFSINVFYTKFPVQDYLQAAFETIKDAFFQWIETGRPELADILVFVQGQEEAEQLCTVINDWSASNSRSVRDINAREHSAGSLTEKDLPSGQLLAVPLYSGLDVDRQIAILSSSFSNNSLKVVVTTSVAESTVTVPRIRTVIDCGLEKIESFDPSLKTSFVLTVPISVASAKRRARRAGLHQQGDCFRLYTESYLKSNMMESRPPAIFRCELTDMLLILNAIGVADITSFDFFERPNGGLVVDALERLFYLGALSKSGRMTAEIGVRLCRTSLNPRMAKCILVGESYGVGRVMAAVAALLEVKQVLFKNDGRRKMSKALFAVAEGDVLTMVNVWRRYVNSGFSDSWCTDHGINVNAMQQMRRSFARTVRAVLKPQSPDEKFAAARKAIGLSHVECICRSIAAGYFENAAMVEPNGSYLLALSGRRVKIHRQSVLYKRMPKWVTYIVLAQSSTVCEMRNVTVIQPQWLKEYAGLLFEAVSDKLQLEGDTP